MDLALLLTISILAALNILWRRMALLARLAAGLMLLSSLVSLLIGVVLVLLAGPLTGVSCLLLAILGLLPCFTFLGFLIHV